LHAARTFAPLTRHDECFVLEHVARHLDRLRQLRARGGAVAPRKRAHRRAAPLVQPFDASAYRDDYEEKLHAVLDARARGKVTRPTEPKAPKATNVVDLADVLRRSLASHAATPRKAATHARPHRGRKAS
jgi:hypothetical protein